MNFNINLATRVYVDFAKVNAALAVTVAGIVVWSVISVFQLLDNIERSGRFSEHKSRLERGKSGKNVSDAEYATFQAKVKAVNAILAKRSQDWLLLLDSLEQLVPSGIALKGFEPLEKGALVKISGSASSFSLVRRFIENLQSSSVFTDIYLTDQTPFKEAGRKGINFTVTCKVAAQ